ncbi:MAG: DUF3300 domain-containing protein [bacterium]|nr:DUF3300 domain-containing protein [bacterium]
MKQLRYKVTLSALLICLLALPALAAPASLSNSELERILAPIALFPDSLLGNILTAATRPDEVIAADAWIAEHSDLSADRIMKECESQPWDPSVKALLLVPETLEQMCNNMTWTQELGNAFVDQNDAVFTAIQNLRKKAKDSGSLRDSKDVKVITDQDGSISIGSADPNVIIVPRYSPSVVYVDSPRISTTSAIVWGCVFVAGIVYDCCVWDWHRHHYWCGPGYNHCYYYGGIFYPWGPRCYVPRPLHHRHGPPPPPCRPSRPPHYDRPSHQAHRDYYRAPDYHGRHHQPHGGSVQPHNSDPAVNPRPNNHLINPNAVASSQDGRSMRRDSTSYSTPEHRQNRSRQQHNSTTSRHRLSNGHANLIPRQTIDSASVSTSHNAFSGSRQRGGSHSASIGSQAFSRPSSASSSLTPLTGSNSNLGHLHSSSSRSSSYSSSRSYSSDQSLNSHRQSSSSSGRSFSNHSLPRSHSFSNSSRSIGHTSSSTREYGSRSSRHGRK